MISEIPLSGGFYQSESLPVSSQRCLNFYVNVPETMGISQAQLYPTPGLTEVANSGDFEVNRGSHSFRSEPYFVNGNKLYRLNRVTGSATSFSFSIEDLGTIAGTGRVSISDNGIQLIIVVPGTGIGYTYEKTNGLQQITDPDFTANGNAEIVVFVDGYFVFSTAGKKFFVSNINDGTSYNPLAFGTAEADPDDIRGLHVHRNQLYVFGSQTCEAFRNVGGIGLFPFQRITGYVLPKGLASKFSIAEFDDTFAFIGQGDNEAPQIYVHSGNNFTVVSTTAIDLKLQENTDIQLNDAFAWSYAAKGEDFIGWTTAAGTFVLQSKSSKLTQKKVWCERRSENLRNQEAWRVNSIVTAYGKVLCGDSEGGVIGELDFDSNTDYGEFVTREVALPTISNESKRVFHNSFEIEIESGINSDPSAEPKIALSYSNDGRIFTSDRLMSAGKTGESIKAKRFRLGQSNRFRIYKLTMTDNNRYVLLKALVDLDAV